MCHFDPLGFHGMLFGKMVVSYRVVVKVGNFLHCYLSIIGLFFKILLRGIFS